MLREPRAGPQKDWSINWRVAAAVSFWFVTGVAFAAIATTMLSSAIMRVHVRSPWMSHDADYLIGLLAAVLLGVGLVAWPFRAREKVALVALWLVKVSIALGPALLYEGHYEVLDAYTFHDNARDGLFEVTDMGWGRGTENVTLLLQAIYTIIPPSYHSTKILFTFLGLIGLYLVYRGAVKAWGGRSLVPLFVLALFPGVLFWSSILGKEPLMHLALGLYIYGLGSLRSASPKAMAGLFLMLGLLLAGALRIWMVYLLLVPLMWMIAMDARFSRPAKLAGLALIFIVGALFWVPSLERVGVGGEIGMVERIDVISKSWDRGGSSQDVPEFSAFTDLIAFAPLGAFTALFRPLPGEIDTGFGLVASFENVLLLVLVFLTVLRIRICLKDALFVGLAMLVAAWAGAYGFVSYQNLGTAVRFKAQILPAVLLLAMYPWWTYLAKGHCRFVPISYGLPPRQAMK